MRTLNTFRFVAVAALGTTVIAPVALSAQSQSQSVAARPASAVVEALMRDIAALEEKLLGLAEAIPEEKYGWRPGEGVRSVHEVMTHVAADNYFLPTFAGVPAPDATGIKSGDYPSVQAYEKRTAPKAETLQTLRASFAHLKSAMQMADQQFLDQTLDIFGTKMSGLDLTVLTTTHLHEHLGQVIAYARSNGVVPPWSR
jgi:uncharacterized damage-inducible protein DinB